MRGHSGRCYRRLLPPSLAITEVAVNRIEVQIEDGNTCDVIVRVAHAELTVAQANNPNFEAVWDTNYHAFLKTELEESDNRAFDVGLAPERFHCYAVRAELDVVGVPPSPWSLVACTYYP